MARPGSLKAAAKPTTPAWYNGDVDGNGMIGLLVYRQAFSFDNHLLRTFNFALQMLRT